MSARVKYIVVAVDGRESIFTFPSQVIHAEMLDAIQRLTNGERDWKRIFFRPTCVGAGFIADGKCYGMSESIGVKSRGETDTALLSIGQRDAAPITEVGNE